MCININWPSSKEVNFIRTVLYVSQIMRYLYVSRSGLSENELLDLIPGLSWTFLAPFCYIMIEHLVLKYQGGLLMFAHEQVSHATVNLNP